MPGRNLLLLLIFVALLGLIWWLLRSSRNTSGRAGVSGAGAGDVAGAGGAPVPASSPVAGVGSLFAESHEPQGHDTQNHDPRTDDSSALSSDDPDRPLREEEARISEERELDATLPSLATRDDDFDLPETGLHGLEEPEEVDAAGWDTETFVETTAEAPAVAWDNSITEAEVSADLTELGTPDAEPDAGDAAEPEVTVWEEESVARTGLMDDPAVELVGGEPQAVEPSWPAPDGADVADVVEGDVADVADGDVADSGTVVESVEAVESVDDSGAVVESVDTVEVDVAAGEDPEQAVEAATLDEAVETFQAEAPAAAYGPPDDASDAGADDGADGIVPHNHEVADGDVADSGTVVESVEAVESVDDSGAVVESVDTVEVDVAAGEDPEQAVEAATLDEAVETFQAEAPAAAYGPPDDASDAGADDIVPHNHEVVDGGWSVGSAAPIADGCMPLGHPIKAVYALGIYQVPGSDWYAVTAPDVWFTDEGAAQRAGFRRGEG